VGEAPGRGARHRGEILGQTVILTDDVERGERLARNLGGGTSVVLHDLYGDAVPPRAASLIISDVSALTSESVRRLRPALSPKHLPQA